MSLRHQLPEHCKPTKPLLASWSSLLAVCIPTPQAFASTILGSLSILAWLCAQMPQLYKNYRNRSASGLSIYFLSEWLLGDVANLAGAMLTGQASWQVAIATYYVIIDLSLTLQYLWYNNWKRQRRLQKTNGVYTCDGRESPNRRNHDCDQYYDSHECPSANSKHLAPDRLALHIEGQESNSAQTQMSPAEVGPSATGKTCSVKPLSATAAAQFVVLMPKAVAAISISLDPMNQDVNRALYTQRTSVFARMTAAPSSTIFLGSMLSWISTILYFASRMPQIYKNFKRGSTTGLSPYMFGASFTGNLLYSAALMTNPCAWKSYAPHGAHGWVGENGSDQRQWLALAAPFWLGAAGVLMLDACIGIQFLFYKEKSPLSEAKLVISPLDGIDQDASYAMPGEACVISTDDNDTHTTPVDRQDPAINISIKRDQTSHFKFVPQGSWHRVTGWMRGWVPSSIPCDSTLIARRSSHVHLGHANETSIVESQGRPLLEDIE